MFQSADDPLDVLYGQETIEIRRESEGPGALAARKLDGLFRPGRNRRVSAVLHIPQLWPWTIAAAEPELWVNPFALNPVPIHLRWVAKITLAGTVIRRRTAERPLRELFGLPETWPGPEGAFVRRGSA
jgi:hypothetical protein